MYLDTNKAQEFYLRYADDKELFSNITVAQLTVCRKYFLKITKYNVESIEGKSVAVGDTEYVDSICNLNDMVKCETIDGTDEMCYIGYRLRNKRTGKESIVSEELMAKIMFGRNTMLRAISESTLADIKYCVYLSLTNNTGEYIKDKSKRLALVLEDTTVNDKFILLYKELYNNYLALPRFLLERFNNKLDVDYMESVFNRYTTLFTKNTQAILNYQHAISEFGKDAIVNSAEHEERLKYAELITDYAKAYVHISRSGRIDLMQFVKAGKQQVYYVHRTNGGERLATKTEVKLLVSACFKRSVYFIAEEKLNHLRVFAWAHTGQFELLNSAGYNIREYAGKGTTAEDNNRVMFDKDIMDAITNSIAYLMSDEFLQVDALELVKGTKPVEYLDTAEDEIHDLGLKVKLEAIKSKCSGTNNEFLNIAYDIAYKALKFNNVVLSPKQMNVVNKAYEALEAETTNNMYSEELESKMRKIREFNRYKKGTFMAKLVSTISKNKRCSAKQYDIIQVEYEKFQAVNDYGADGIDSDDSGVDYYKQIKYNGSTEEYSVIRDDTDDSVEQWESSWSSGTSEIPDINDLFSKE